jgi:DNA-binding ferritin-like protein
MHDEPHPVPAAPLPVRALAARELVPALSCVLGNACRLARATKYCAWNTRGPGSAAAARAFARQARVLGRTQDRIAECIAYLGGVAIPDEQEAIVVDPPGDGSDEARGPAWLAATLREAHERSMLSLNAVGDLALDLDDRALQALLVEWLLVHRRCVVELDRIRAGSAEGRTFGDVIRLG